MAQQSNDETAVSLSARAEQCRALARVAYLPWTAKLLLGLAQQLDGEAQRKSQTPNDNAAA